MDQNEGMYEDQVVTCRDCNSEFVFSAGEQAFFAQKGFMAPPKRCKPCRDKKKTGENRFPEPREILAQLRAV